MEYFSWYSRVGQDNSTPHATHTATCKIQRTLLRDGGISRGMLGDHINQSHLVCHSIQTDANCPSALSAHPNTLSPPLKGRATPVLARPVPNGSSVIASRVYLTRQMTMPRMKSPSFHQTRSTRGRDHVAATGRYASQACTSILSSRTSRQALL